MHGWREHASQDYEVLWVTSWEFRFMSRTRGGLRFLHVPQRFNYRF
jgi:hypothetical protein